MVKPEKSYEKKIVLLRALNPYIGREILFSSMLLEKLKNSLTCNLVSVSCDVYFEKENDLLLD